MIEEVHRMVGVPLVSEAAGDDGEVDDDVAEGSLAIHEGPPAT